MSASPLRAVRCRDATRGHFCRSTAVRVTCPLDQRPTACRRASWWNIGDEALSKVRKVIGTMKALAIW